MSLMRKSSVEQMKRINQEIKKQGGGIDSVSDSEKGMPNAMWNHNPFEADSDGKRKIATYDDMYTTDIPDADVKVKMKNENNVISFEKMFEKMDDGEILNEDKMMDFLSDNFQKLTKEIQKNREDIQHVVDELNNIVKVNNLKRK